MKYAFLFAFWAFLGVEGVFSQPEIEWQRSFGGGNTEEANSIIQTTDGGYAVAGYTASMNGDIFGHHGYYDCWVLKLDAGGNIEWKKLYGGNSLEFAYDIEQTPDGGYIFAGITFSENGQVSGHQGKGDYWVVKIDANGEIQWQRTLGGSERDEAQAIKLTLDGGYIVAGSSESSDGDVALNRGGKDYWVVKLNSLGDIEWERSYGGAGYDLCWSMAVCSDGGYILAGQSNSLDGQVSSPFNNGDYWVVKLNFDGKIEWEKSFGGNSIDSAFEVLESRHGGFTVLGQASSSSGQVIGHHGSFDLWVVKLDEIGELIWQSTLGGSSLEYANGFAQTEDGGYVLLGSTQSTDGDVMGNDGGADLWVVKINQIGELMWQKTMGGTKAEFGYDIVQTAEGGYITAGFSFSNNGDVTQNKGKTDFWIVKLSKETTHTQEPLTRTLQIYPNPANKTIHLQIPNSSSEPLEITLFSPAGQEMRRFSAQSSAGVDVSILPVGVYSVRAQTLEGVVYLGRFTKS